MNINRFLLLLQVPYRGLVAVAPDLAPAPGPSSCPSRSGGAPKWLRLPSESRWPESGAGSPEATKEVLPPADLTSREPLDVPISRIFTANQPPALQATS